MKGTQQLSYKAVLLQQPECLVSFAVKWIGSFSSKGQESTEFHHASSPHPRRNSFYFVDLVFMRGRKDMKRPQRSTLVVMKGKSVMITNKHNVLNSSRLPAWGGGRWGVGVEVGV